MNLYDIQKYFYGNQNILRKNIINNLEVPFKEFDGNIYSIRKPGFPVFIAHMDTVGVCNMSSFLRIRAGILTRKNSGLGADDRAGVALIMKHHKNINFIFTRDEEIGRKGATALAQDKDFQKDLEGVTAIIQLDCTGHKVVRGALHGYCQEDLMVDLRKVIPDIKDSHGSFSDLDEFIDKKPGINLSVGYYLQHTKQESLNMRELSFVDSKIIGLNNGLIGTYKIPEKKKYTYFTYNRFEAKTKYSGNTFPRWDPQASRYFLTKKDSNVYYKNKSNDNVCDCCGEFVPVVHFLKRLRMFLCDDCVIDTEIDICKLRF